MDRAVRVRLEGVSKVYRVGEHEERALNPVTVEMFGGEVLALVGPSGSGKSTLLRLAGGLDVPSAGEVLVDGKRLDTMTARELALMRRDKVGYIFQEYNLVYSLTALENVRIPLDLAGTRTSESKTMAVDALSNVGLGDLGDRFPDELSGGQRQRVAIARALVSASVVILADEPTGALDSATAAGVVATLRNCAADGRAVVIATHDEAVARAADRVLTLRDGNVVADVRRGPLATAVANVAP